MLIDSKETMAEHEAWGDGTNVTVIANTAACISGNKTAWEVCSASTVRGSRGKDETHSSRKLALSADAKRRGLKSRAVSSRSGIDGRLVKALLDCKVLAS